MHAGVILITFLAAATPVAAESFAPPGAAACSGCHGSGRSAIPSLQGQAPEAIAAAMRDFRSGRLPATVMDRIAKGFSDDEIRAIADWLGRRE